MAPKLPPEVSESAIKSISKLFEDAWPAAEGAGKVSGEMMKSPFDGDAASLRRNVGRASPSNLEPEDRVHLGGMKTPTYDGKDSATPAMQILQDHFTDQPVGTNPQTGTKVYGQQSMSVKKDLLKSLSADVAPMRPGFMPPETPALLENVDKRETRRTAAHGGAVHSMTFEPTTTPDRERAYSPPRYGGAENYSLEDEARMTKHSVVAGPRIAASTEKLGPGDRHVWQSLMDDPAYPMIAAAVAGGAAALSSSDAEAAPAKAPNMSVGKATTPRMRSWEGITPLLLASDKMAGPDAPDHAVASHGYQKFIDAGLASISPPALAWEGAKALEENVLDPYVLKPLQKKFGAPALEGVLGVMKDTAEPGADPTGSRAAMGERLQRKAGSLWAGSKQSAEYDASAKGQEAGKEQKRIFGKVGSPVLDFAARTYGDSPLFVIRGPRVAKLLGDGSVAQLTESLGTGAAFGLADPEMSMSEGAAGVGVLHASGEALSRVLNYGHNTLGEVFRGVTEHFKGAPEVVPDIAKNFKYGKPGPEIKLGPLGEGRAAQNKIGSDVLGKDVMAAEAARAAMPNGTLVGVISKSGINTIASELARHPDTELPRAPRMLGQRYDVAPKGKPSFITGTLDAEGRPVVKMQWDDPQGPLGYIVKSQPLTAKLAEKLAGSEGAIVTLDPSALSSAGGELPPEFAKLMGQDSFGLYSKPRYTRAPKAEEIQTLAEASDHDYIGSPQEAAGAELRMQDGRVIATPVHEGETRLPDETAIVNPDDTAIFDRGHEGFTEPGVVPSQLSGPNPKRGMTRRYAPGDVTRPAFGGGREGDTQIEGRVSDAVTQLADVGDAMKIGVKPIFGGGSGGKPPSGPKALPPGAGPIRVVGAQAIERPAAVPMPEEATVTWDQREGLDHILRNLKNIAQDRSGGDKILAALVGKHLRGPVDQATLVQSIQATNLLQRSSDDLFQAARKQFGGKFYDQLDKDLNSLFTAPNVKGQSTADRMLDFQAKHPELTDKGREFGAKMMAEKEALDSFLQSKGVVPDDLGAARLNGTLDLYLTRKYLAFAMPQGQWAKRLLSPGMDATLREGADFVLKEARKRNPNITADEVLPEVLRIIRAPDPLQAMKDSQMSVSFGPLLERKEVPAPIRKMMGEIESGTANIAMTLGMQRSIAAKVQLMEEVALDPRWSSDTLNPALEHNYRLPDHIGMYAARNRYVNRDIYEAIGNAPKLEAASHALVHNVLGFIKGNQVALGGLGPHINSVFGNLQSGVLAGGLDLTRPLKSGASLKKAFLAMRDYARDPTGTTGFGGIVLDAKRVGSDYFGFGHEEIGNPGARKFLSLIEDAFPQDKPTSLFEAWGRVMQKSFTKFRDLQSHGGRPLDYVDRLFRMQSFIALQEKFIADLAKNGDASILVKNQMLPATQSARVGIHGNEGRLEGFTEYQKTAAELRAINNGLVTAKAASGLHRAVVEAAARLAARRVNQSFWNPTFIGSGLDSLRRGAVGVVTPYATSAFETFRVNAGIPLRLAQEPDLKWRLLTTAIAVGGVAGLMKQFSGVSDDQIDEAYSNTPKSKQTFKPATFALPWHDGKGRVQTWDMTRVWDPLRYAVGHPDDQLMRRVLVNFFMSPVEGTEAGSFTRDAFVAGGFVKPTDYQKPPTGDVTGAVRLMQHLHKSGLFPGVFRGMIQGAQGVDLLPGRSPTTEPLTYPQAGLKAMGISNNDPIGGDASRRGKQIEKRGELKEKKAEVKRTIFKRSH